MKRKNLENTLPELVRELKPMPLSPENAAEHWSIELDGTEKTNSRWMTYMSDALKTAKPLRSTAGRKKRSALSWRSNMGNRRIRTGSMGRSSSAMSRQSFVLFCWAFPSPQTQNFTTK